MANRYWVGNGGDWSDNTNHWSASSGGAPGASKPGASDKAIFDSSSFSAAAQTVTLDESVTVLDFIWTGVTNEPVLDGTNKTISIYGTLTFADTGTMTVSNCGTINFRSTATSRSITSGGHTLGDIWFFDAGGWTLQDNLTSGNIFYLNGTFNTNNKSVSCQQFDTSLGVGVRSLSLGSSIITASIGISFSANDLTFNAGTSKFIITGDSANFIGDGLSFYDLELQGATPSISGDNTFNKLILKAGETVSIYAGSTQTVSDLPTDGTADDLITLQSTEEGTSFTLSKTSGTIEVNYYSIKDCVVSGGAIFKAFNSVDISGNVGWLFFSNGRNYLIDNEFISIAPGWNISDKINARSTLSVTVIDAQDATIIEGAEFQMYNGVTKIFEGVILRIRKFEPFSGELNYALDIVDNSALADKRVIAKSYTEEDAGDVVTDLITEVLNEENVTAGTIATGLEISKAVFNYIKCSAALDYIKDVTGYNWNIDKDKQLQFFDRSTNTAPWTLDDTVQHSGFQQESTMEDYRTIQYVRGGKGRTSTQSNETPTPAPDGKSRNFVLRFAIAEQPTIEVNLNGVGWVAIDSGDIGINGLNTGKKWYWSYGSQILTQDTSETVLATVDALRVTYTGLRNLFMKIENTDEITLNGKYEALNTEKSITTSEQCREYAEGLIETYGEIKDIITFKTEVAGLEAGQLLPVNKTLYGINDTFLIESVNISAPDANSIEYSVKALDGAAIGGWEEFFKELLKGNRDYAINENEVILLINNQTESEGYEGSIEIDVFNALYPQTDNLVLSPEMDTDSNSDGVVNDFTPNADGGITATYALDDSAQRINITASTSVLRAYVFQSIGCNVGDVVSMGCTYKISGNVTLQFWIEWYNSSNVYISSSSFATGTSASYVTAENSYIVAPANAASARMRLGIKPNAIGNTGSAWIKNATLVTDDLVPLYPSNDLYPNNTVVSEVTVND